MGLVRFARLPGFETALLSVHIVQHPDAAGTVFHRQHEFVLGQRKLDEVNLIRGSSGSGSRMPSHGRLLQLAVR